MKNLTEVKFDLPIYWATYIMYADESGLEKGEKKIIDEILQDLEVSNCIDVLDNQYLELYPPSYMPSNMGGDYCTYVFWRTWETWRTRRQAETRRQALIQ